GVGDRVRGRRGDRGGDRVAGLRVHAVPRRSDARRARDRAGRGLAALLTAVPATSERPACCYVEARSAGTGTSREPARRRLETGFVREPPPRCGRPDPELVAPEA